MGSEIAMIRLLVIHLATLCYARDDLGRIALPLCLEQLTLSINFPELKYTSILDQIL